jgi:hypothetical protein
MAALVHVVRRVASEIPFRRNDVYVNPGEHEPYMNRHGAVSVVAANGDLIGLKPDEFYWVDTAAQYNNDRLRGIAGCAKPVVSEPPEATIRRMRGG